MVKISLKFLYGSITLAMDACLFMDASMSKTSVCYFNYFYDFFLQSIFKVRYLSSADKIVIIETSDKLVK